MRRLVPTTLSALTLALLAAAATAAPPKAPAQQAPAAPAKADAAPVTAEALLAAYDAVMGPPNFEAQIRMVAYRDDGTNRDYTMKVLKKGDEKFRIWFSAPSAVAGQEMLRVGDNLWVYMPNLKRAVRLANRDSFQGGDFNNADVLRVNYQKDYSARIDDGCGSEQAYCVELTAKTKNASYDRVQLWLRKSDRQPVAGAYYGGSGKLLRRATFRAHKSYAGLVRPGEIVMRNMLNKKRYSIMAWESITTRVDPSASRFVLDDMGK